MLNSGFFHSALWMNLVALSILGVSVALALMPTFQGVLNSAMLVFNVKAVISIFM